MLCLSPFAIPWTTWHTRTISDLAYVVIKCSYKHSNCIGRVHLLELCCVTALSLSVASTSSQWLGTK
jgi:hypothetical protein